MNVKKFDATHIKTLRQTMTKYRYTLLEDTTHIETQPTQIRFGFSLAEVLITLGIIGVVAAMTIPNLMAKYQKRSNALRWRKAYATITQAVKLMQEDETPIPSSRDFSTQGDYEYALATLFSKHMKTSAVCHEKKFIEEGCSPKPYPIYIYGTKNFYDGVGTASRPDVSYKGGGSTCLTTLNGEVMCLDANIIMVDVNGYSRPNTLGEDIFFAILDTENYVVRPTKGYKEGWGPADDVLVSLTKGDGSCSKVDGGAGCSYFYIHNLP